MTSAQSTGIIALFYTLKELLYHHLMAIDDVESSLHILYIQYTTALEVVEHQILTIKHNFLDSSI